MLSRTSLSGAGRDLTWCSSTPRAPQSARTGQAQRVHGLVNGSGHRGPGTAHLQQQQHLWVIVCNRRGLSPGFRGLGEAVQRQCRRAHRWDRAGWQDPQNSHCHPLHTESSRVDWVSQGSSVPASNGGKLQADRGRRSALVIPFHFPAIDALVTS